LDTRLVYSCVGGLGLNAKNGTNTELLGPGVEQKLCSKVKENGTVRGFPGAQSRRGVLPKGHELGTIRWDGKSFVAVCSTVGPGA